MFDNGEYAKCLCRMGDGTMSELYIQAPVRYESIRSSMKRSFNGQSMADHDSNGLRDAWNLFAQDGIIRNELPEGQW